MKKWIFLCFPLILVTFPGFGRAQTTLPCEVMEASEALSSTSSKLNGIRYILLHHANSADRKRLSKWLKAHNGTEVKFFANRREYKGILCRLAQCFGRGLLIYTGDFQAEKRDIIEVILPSNP
ncbi:MAG: hypothetical protein J7J91_10120 [Deltaproteobacteria bacterium]|nr:hypothetical protein [Deltaproteobacteria bacterium]